MLGLLVAGSLIAEDTPERYTLDIYVHVYSACNDNTVNIGYLDYNGTQHDIHTYQVGGGYTLIHCPIEIWPGVPPAELVFAEGWGCGYYDYDEEDATFYERIDLYLWLGVAPDDPTIPQEE